MPYSTTSGTKLYIATGASANSSPADATAYAALTWTEVAGVTNFGSFGDTAELVTLKIVAESRVRKLKGTYNAGTMEIVCARDPLDAGQAAAAAAAATKFTYNFKVVANDKADANDTNSIWYFGAKVMSGAINLGAADDPTEMKITLEIDTAITYVAATEVA